MAYKPRGIPGEEEESSYQSGGVEDEGPGGSYKQENQYNSGEGEGDVSSDYMSQKHEEENKNEEEKSTIETSVDKEEKK